jgi:hypothetical protein
VGGSGSWVATFMRWFWRVCAGFGPWGLAVVLEREGGRNREEYKIFPKPKSSSVCW